MNYLLIQSTDKVNRGTRYMKSRQIRVLLYKYFKKKTSRNTISDRRTEKNTTTTTVRLESWNFKYAKKNMDGVTNMTVKEQHSDAPCVLGKSFGFDGSKIWVDKGCRADFYVTKSK